MEASLWVWAVALESGYISLSDIVAWADRQVLHVSSPPSWIIDLCLARTPEDAQGLLMAAWYRYLESPGPTRPGSEAYDDLYMGFLYLRFQRGDLSMAEMLNLAGRYSDSRGCGIPCEDFFLLLNEIDGGGPTIPSDRPLSERVAELFAPMEETARRHLDLLPTGTHKS
jgi:hypothetical protein